MPRRIRLPDPYPDETCYSILCRYAVRSGAASSSRVTAFLYGNTMPLAGLLYKPFRISDIERWGGPGSGDTPYGESHSCLPYFSVFMGYDDSCLLKKCRHGMQLSPGLTKRISRKCGLMQIRKKRLWYCPACAAEDFREYGETYWRRLPQMPGVSYCPRHMVRLCESGLAVSEVDYRILPASYVLLHIPDAGARPSGNIFGAEFLQVAEDTGWLLENGFRLPDNSALRALFEERSGIRLDEHAVYSAGAVGKAGFEHYLAARFLKESGRRNIGPAAQKYLSTLLSIDRVFGSFENFWRNAGHDKKGTGYGITGRIQSDRAERKSRGKHPDGQREGTEI